MDKPKQEMVAVDLDGTLAEYQEGDLEKYGHDHIGNPIPEMVDKVKALMAQGTQVFIFTARVNPKDNSFEEHLDATRSYIVIAQWCEHYLGQMLPVTCQKLRTFTKMIDDRSIQVIPNTGVFLSELVEATQGK